MRCRDPRTLGHHPQRTRASSPIPQTDDSSSNRDLTIHSINAVEFQMNLLFSPTFLNKVLRASSLNTLISHFHNHASHHNHTRSSRGNNNHNPDAWAVKVIYSVIVFRCCSKKNFLDFSSLEHFIKHTLINPSIVYQVIIRLNNPKLALKFFEFTHNRSENSSSPVECCNFLVRSLCEIGLHDEASKLVFNGYVTDWSTLDLLVSLCARAGKFEIVKALLGEVHCSKVGLSLVTCNNLLNVLVKSNRVDEAVWLFQEQKGFCRDTCSFNIVIRGLFRRGDVVRAFHFFNDMKSYGCYPDLVTYNTIINGLVKMNQTERGHEFLKEIFSSTAFSPDVVTYTSVISGYCKLGKMEEASGLFYEMGSFGIRPSLVTYNVVIDGFGKAGDMGSAVVTYEKMLLQGCGPDVVTFTSLIDGYCRAGEVDEAMKVWHEMGRRKLFPNAYTFAVLINAFCKGNRLNEAREFLRQLKWSDIVPQPFIYNPVIDGFCKAGNVDEANMIVKEMEEKRCKPDKLTFTILIIGHCMKGRMSEAIVIFKKMLTTNCAPDTITISSLLSCLLKAGMPNEASKIFHSVSEKQFDLSLSNRKVHSLRKDMEVPVAL